MQINCEGSILNQAPKIYLIKNENKKLTKGVLRGLSSLFDNI